jgi:hypothetical protein
MVFELPDKKTTTCNLANPKAGLTKEAVTAAMDAIIAKKMLVVNGMNPTAIKEAVIRSTEDSQLA